MLDRYIYENWVHTSGPKGHHIHYLNVFIGGQPWHRANSICAYLYSVVFLDTPSSHKKGHYEVDLFVQTLNGRNVLDLVCIWKVFTHFKWWQRIVAPILNSWPLIQWSCLERVGLLFFYNVMVAPKVLGVCIFLLFWCFEFVVLCGALGCSALQSNLNLLQHWWLCISGV